MLRKNVPPAIDTSIQKVQRAKSSPKSSTATFLTSFENTKLVAMDHAESPVSIAHSDSTKSNSTQASDLNQSRNTEKHLRSPFDKIIHVFRRSQSPPIHVAKPRFLTVQDAAGNRRVISIDGIHSEHELMEKIFSKFQLQLGTTADEFGIALVVSDQKTVLLSPAQLLRSCQFDPDISKHRFILQLIGKNSETNSLEQNSGFTGVTTWSTRPATDTIALNLDFYFPTISESDLHNTLKSMSQQSSYEDQNEKRNSNNWSSQFKRPGNSHRASVFSYLSARLSFVNDSQDAEVSPVEFQKGLDNWIQGDLIGRGSFARVYFGINPVTGQIMAVKQVEVGLIDRDSERRTRMLRASQKEVEILSRLNHMHIVKFYGSGYDYHQTVFNLFLEYLSGGTLESLLRRSGSLSIEASRHYTRQILEGLAFLHDCGIIHRDIKSANLLITSDDILKISDFGVSTLIASLNGEEKQQRMSMQGSIFWMAPEVIRRENCTTAIDIWSVGCVVLEMLTGKRPWLGYDSIQACYQIGSQICTPLDVFDQVNASKSDSSILMPGCAREFLLATFNLSPGRRPAAHELQSFRFCAAF